MTDLHRRNGRYTQGKIAPAPNQDHIPLEEVTIAERLARRL